MKTPMMPQPGQTLTLDSNVDKVFGGKGANQAIAATRLQNKLLEEKDQFIVQMLGQVGNDPDGEALI